MLSTRRVSYKAISASVRVDGICNPIYFYYQDLQSGIMNVLSDYKS
jgi:hypothetical protein